MHPSPTTLLTPHYTGLHYTTLLYTTPHQTNLHHTTLHRQMELNKRVAMAMEPAQAPLRNVWCSWLNHHSTKTKHLSTK